MRSNFIFLWIAIFFAAAPQVYAADGKAGGSTPGMKHLYLSYCVLCHSESGKGGGPLSEKMKLKASDLTDAKIQAKSIDEIAKAIGGSGGPKKAESKMPSWDKELPPNVLKGIATYVKWFSGAAEARDCSGKSNVEEVYSNACIACHGRYGNGKGLLANLIGLHDSKGKPMADWSKKDYNKDTASIKKAIVNGQGDMMPGWKGVLCENEVDGVTAYVLEFKNQKK